MPENILTNRATISLARHLLFIMSKWGSSVHYRGWCSLQGLQ